MERHTRRGLTFYGCNNYPECDVVTWDTPQEKPCDKCGSLMMKHHFKNGRALLYCTNDKCETRVNHPINKELARIKEKAEKAKADKEKKAAADKSVPDVKAAKVASKSKKKV